MYNEATLIHPEYWLNQSPSANSTFPDIHSCFGRAGVITFTFWCQTWWLSV